MAAAAAAVAAVQLQALATSPHGWMRANAGRLAGRSASPSASGWLLQKWGPLPPSAPLPLRWRRLMEPSASAVSVTEFGIFSLNKGILRRFLLLLFCCSICLRGRTGV